MKICITGEKGDIPSQIDACLKKNGFPTVYPHHNNSPVDCLIHMGAKGPTTPLAQLIEGNISRTQSLYSRYCHLTSKVIFFSSTSILGTHRAGLLNEHSSPQGTLDAYGLTKLLGEQLSKTYFSTSYTLVLPALLEYRNSRNLLSRLFDNILAEKPVNLVNGHLPYNNYIDCDSVGAACGEIIHANANDQSRFILAAKPEYTLIDICKTIKTLAGSHTPIHNRVDRSHQPCQLDTTAAENTLNFKPPDPVTIINQWINQRLKKLTTS